MAPIRKPSIDSGMAAPTWTRAKTLKLIRMYQQNEHMWNQNSVLFRSQTPRKNTWQQMSAAMKVPIHQIVLKIQSLRKIFKYNWRKAQAIGDEGAVKWCYYEKLKFIESSFLANEAPSQRVRMRKNKRRSAPQKRRRPPPTPPPLPSPPAPVPADNVMDVSVSNSSANTNSTEASSEAFFGFSTTNNNHTSRNDRSEEIEDIYIACGSNSVAMPKIEYRELGSTSTAAVRRVDLAPPIEDRTDRFFKGIAETVKTFPPRTVAEIKLNISTMVGQAELQLASGEEILCESHFPEPTIFQETE